MCTTTPALTGNYRGCLRPIENFMTKKRCKKKGALLTFEAVGYTGLLIILVVLGVAGLGLFETYRIVSCRWELRELSAACISYKTLNVNNALPTDLTLLVKDDGLAAADSNDGVQHGNFIRKSQRWTESSINNPWNKQYVITPADGTITCDTDSLVGQMSTEIGESDI